MPDVLSPQDCRMPMDLWERENIETGVATEESGVGGQEIDHPYKNRRGHQIADPGPALDLQLLHHVRGHDRLASL